MPITAKLSRRFYETLGDEVTNELVDWLNAVDQSYRQEFKDLFDANFGRLEARMAQQSAEIRSDLRWEMLQHGTRLEVKMAESHKSVLRWMFAFWVANIGTLVALLKL